VAQNGPFFFPTRLTFICTSVANISHGRRFDDISDDELFNGLVFGHTSSTIGAVNVHDMSSTVFGTTAISSFLRLFGEK
jgi:hypothetical protein